MGEQRKSKQPLTRSEVMARIRSRDTGPELLLRRQLFAAGLRYRVHWRVEGICRADVAFTRLRVAVFVDGCFWHGCPEHAVRPRANAAFWDAKLDRNHRRDLEQTKRLQEAGWLVLRFWEHEVAASPAYTSRRVIQALAKRRKAAGCGGW